MIRLSLFPSPAHKPVSDSALRLRQVTLLVQHIVKTWLIKALPSLSELQKRNEDQILTTVQKKTEREFMLIPPFCLLSSPLSSTVYPPLPQHQILVFSLKPIWLLLDTNF